jgi:hypothetical protein
MSNARFGIYKKKTRGHNSDDIIVIGYKLLKKDGIKWVVCPIHGMAHPVDFPCRGCLISDIINQTSG